MADDEGMKQWNDEDSSESIHSEIRSIPPELVATEPPPLPADALERAARASTFRPPESPSGVRTIPPPPRLPRESMPSLSERYDLGAPDERAELPKTAGPSLVAPAAPQPPSWRRDSHVDWARLATAACFGLALGMLSGWFALSATGDTPTAHVLSTPIAGGPSGLHTAPFSVMPEARPPRARHRWGRAPVPRVTTALAQATGPVSGANAPAARQRVSRPRSLATGLDGSGPVQASDRELRRRLSECAGGKSGNALLTLSVRPDGRVSHATVYGPQVDGRVGSCMAQSVRGLVVPGGGDARAVRRIERSVRW